jgi:aminotransferase
MTEASALGCEDDVAFVRRMVQEFGIAGVPGSSFYYPARDGRTKVRFMWAKKDQTLHEAGERLLKMQSLRQ